MRRLKSFNFLFFLLISISLFSNNWDERLSIVASPKTTKIISSEVREFLENKSKFHRKIGKYSDFKVVLNVADDKEEFSDFLKKYNVNNKKFTQAFYSSSANQIFVKNPQDIKNFSNLDKILLHEYIHQFIENYWRNVPLWFHEGMAVYFSEGIRLDKQYHLLKNSFSRIEIPIWKMYRYPDHKDELEYFYGKSALIVKYMFQKNQTVFFKFLDSAKRKRDFNRHFKLIFHSSIKYFSLEVEEYLKRYIFIAFFISISTLIWTLLPFLFLIGLVRKKIKTHKIKKKWLEDEKMEILLENDKDLD